MIAIKKKHSLTTHFTKAVKTIAFLISLVSVVSCSTGDLKYEDEILWDTWGIPHIYASNDDGLYKMMGWAQMRNHGNLILKLYGEARGKSSEYWGADPSQDILLNKIGLLEGAENTWQNMSQTDKEVINSFVDGINAYCEKYPGQIEAKYKEVLPVKAVDVMYHTARVMYMEFLIARSLPTAYRWKPGSNAWAVNGSKTATGNAMLLANPHLPWNEFWLFFEAHLIKGNNSLYGTTLVGLPTIGIGFNENLGWTHTVNTLDNVDFFEITIKDNQYLIDGEYRDFEVDSVIVKIKSDNAEDEKLIVKKKSAFGMVFKEYEGKALTITWPNMDGKLSPVSQWKAMGEAENLDEFKIALNQNALPLFNVIYSDKKDNILYHFGGNVPKKNGDWEKWQRILPTSSSEELWDGYYSSSELPGYTNPESGWIQNANDPPFTSTFPPALKPSDYASHISPNNMIFRPQRSAKLIMNASDLTLDNFIKLKHDTKSELALRLQDDFEALKGLTKDSLTTASLNVLTEWDASFEASSKGAILFMNVIQQMGTAGIFETEWSFENPVTSPDGLKNPEQVLGIIKMVAQSQTDQLGNLDPEYGDLFRLKVGAHEFPGNGGPGNIGIFRTLYYVPGGDGKYYPYHGDSFVCAIEFGEKVQAKALLSYGNATQPGNPHVGDQLQLFAKKELRPVWYTRAEHEANLELQEKLSGM